MLRDEGIIADAHLIEAVVLASVDCAIWTATGGSDGCAQCSNKTRGINLSFKERIEKGHLDCAREMAVDEGARGVRYGMTCGDLMARLMGVVADPRLGSWRDPSSATPKEA